MTTSITTLIRNLRVGDKLSFDEGRITIALEDKSGRAARLRLTLADDVGVDKPAQTDPVSRPTKNSCIL